MTIIVVIILFGYGCSEIGLAGDAGQDQAEDEDSDRVPGPCPEGMAYVPAGQFVMGEDSTEHDTRPKHIVTISAYCIDVLQATNARWQACVSAGACSAPLWASSLSREDYYGNPDYDNYPVMLMDWNQARAYCEWLGKRLATEAEWEKAGKGGCELAGSPDACDPGDERIYPWGNEPPTSELANFCPECCESPPCPDTCEACADTIEVGTRPLGASPYGLLDMLGNVAEWMWDVYGEDYYSTGGPPWIDPTGPPDDGTETRRVIKGGYTSNPYSLAHRRGFDYDERAHGLGLRCASDPAD